LGITQKGGRTEKEGPILERKYAQKRKRGEKHDPRGSDASPGSAPQTSLPLGVKEKNLTEEREEKGNVI